MAARSVKGKLGRRPVNVAVMKKILQAALIVAQSSGPSASRVERGDLSGVKKSVIGQVFENFHIARLNHDLLCRPVRVSFELFKVGSGHFWR